MLALVAATDPMRFGIAVMLISRPRPMPNLLAFWLGGMATGVTAALGVLILLRNFAPRFTENVASTAASSTVAHIRIVIGVLALLVAVLITVGFSVRQKMRVSMPEGGPPSVTLQPRSPSAFSRLSARIQDSLGSGFLLVAFVAGLGSATPPVEYLVVLTAILASGTAINIQLSAAVLFTVVVLSVVEIPLISYLAMPAQTQAVMQRVQDWVQARRRGVLAVVLAVGGIVLVASGA